MDFIQLNHFVQWGKRKEGHSSNQTMTSSFSFVALAKANAARLHHKCILWKEIKEKLSLIKPMSSMIQAASKQHIPSEFKRFTSSAELHSTITLWKLVFWQNKKANLITVAAVQKGFKFFYRRWHDAAKTSPFLFLIRKPKPTKVFFFDWEIARLSLWIESEIGGCHFVVYTSATWFCLCCTSINSNL